MAVGKTAKSLEEFENILREYEKETISKFVCSLSEKAFSEEKFTPKEKFKILWADKVPYLYVGRRIYACHKGKDGNKCKKIKFAKIHSDDVSIKKRLVPSTKKLDCPVVINVTRVFSLPRFKVNKITEKQKTSSLIKAKLKTDEDIGGENLYIFQLPDEKSHQNHNIGLLAAITEAKVPRVRLKKKQCVSNRQNNVATISALVEQNGEVTTRKSKRNKLISACSSTLQSLTATIYMMNEEHLSSLLSDLRVLQKKAALNVSHDSGLPVATSFPEPSSSFEANLPKPKKRKLQSFSQSTKDKEEEKQAVDTVS